MKPLYSSAVILAMFTSACATIPPAEPSRPDFDSALAEHLRAITERDLAAYQKTITSHEAFSIIFPNGQRSTTRTEALALHTEWFKDFDWRMRIEEIQRIDLGSAIVVLVRTFYRDRPDSDDREAWLTLTFGLENGAWRLVHDQNTRIDPATS